MVKTGLNELVNRWFEKNKPFRESKGYPVWPFSFTPFFGFRSGVKTLDYLKISVFMKAPAQQSQPSGDTEYNVCYEVNSPIYQTYNPWKK